MTMLLEAPARPDTNGHTEAPAKTLRAAVYCRVSTAGQEEDGTSLVTQEQRCRGYAAQHGYTVAERHVYREVYSGAALHERPMLSEARAASDGCAGELRATVVGLTGAPTKIRRRNVSISRCPIRRLSRGER